MVEDDTMRDINGRFKNGHLKIGGFVPGSIHAEISKGMISQSLIGIIGDEARRWKGGHASYAAKHMWIIKHYGRASRCQQVGCNFHSPKRFEWHNISGNYEREASCYVQLCPSCHRKIDMGRLTLCVV